MEGLGVWITKKRRRTGELSSHSRAVEIGEDTDMSNKGGGKDENVDRTVHKSGTEESDLQPFSFAVRKGCRLACCSGASTISASSPFLRMPAEESLSISTPAIIFLPPPCQIAWFSGVCLRRDHIVVSSIPNNSQFDSQDATLGLQRPMSFLAHEVDIDDCLRCAKGGYLHFRLSITDKTQSIQGSIIVERTGGDMIRFESHEMGEDSGTQIMTFQTTRSYAGTAAVTSLIKRFFPSVMRRLEASPNDIALLDECVVCVGDLNISGLPVQRIVMPSASK